LDFQLACDCRNRSSREIPFQTAPRCDWRHAGLPLRPSRAHLQAHRAALERRAKLQYVLPVRMIERLGNPQNRREPTGDSPVRIV